LPREYDPAIVAVGGLLFCGKERRKKRLDTLLRLFSEQLFHGLGVCNEDLFMRPWFQCDGRAVFTPRQYGMMYTHYGLPVPKYWTVEQAVGFGLEVFTSQEDNYNNQVSMKLMIPPISTPEPLRLF
jgi:hypothetical protein